MRESVGFNLIQGVLDMLFLVAAAISIVYLRVVRSRMRHLAMEKSRKPALPEDPGGGPAQFRSPSSCSAFDPRMEDVLLRQNRELSEMKSLLSRVSMERSRLQVAFYDAERMIEDLENIQMQTPVAAIPVPPLSPDPVAPSPAKVAPLTDQEKAVSWSRSGQSVSEIAQRLGRSEGEVELILGMARLSGGGAG